MARTRMTRGDLLTALCIVVLAVLLTALLIPRAQKGLTVQVVQDTEQLFCISLETVTQRQNIVIEGEYSLTLEWDESGVWVKETTCPGQDCRHMGTITKAGQQIICLPNKLVVTLQGEDPSVDAVIG